MRYLGCNSVAEALKDATTRLTDAALNMFIRFADIAVVNAGRQVAIEKTQAPPALQTCKAADAGDFWVAYRLATPVNVKELLENLYDYASEKNALPPAFDDAGPMANMALVTFFAGETLVKTGEGTSGFFSRPPIIFYIFYETLPPS